MNCPHCQKASPENYTASYCPHCGGALQPGGVADALPPVKTSWLIFFAVLLAPPLLTTLAAFLAGGEIAGDATVAIGSIGGAAGGIACGIMLALRLGKTVGARIVLGILLSCVFAVACITLSCLGCLFGGYEMRFQ